MFDLQQPVMPSQETSFFDQQDTFSQQNVEPKQKKVSRSDVSQAIKNILPLPQEGENGLEITKDELEIPCKTECSYFQTES